MIEHSCPSDKSPHLIKFYGLLLRRGLEVLNQVFRIYLVTLIIILMFLFALFFFLVWLAGISVPVMNMILQYKSEVLGDTEWLFRIANILKLGMIIIERKILSCHVIS